jgi:UDP-N-acetyl-D-glucosamine/UDP-N-acetyl-D-galactosamine dehydrogenase
MPTSAKNARGTTVSQRHNLGSQRQSKCLSNSVIAVLGLGYVGLPLAQAFAKSHKVIGFDIDIRKVKGLCNNQQNLVITADPQQLRQADFIIIAVPTPVTKSKQPDMSYINSACSLIRENLKKGAVVILESTVYPGVTEEVVRPILEESGLKCGKDFKLAYCPERMNPGDEEHTLQTVTKVVSGMDEDTSALVFALYSEICPKVFKATDIRTAEAAKVIENIQRDLNIALINEFALIFDKLGLDTREVLKAASTKWNFLPFSPGLVGGHCIPVDPYYLVYKAEEVGYHPQVILAGRAINDYMPNHVADIAIKAINNADKVIRKSKVLIMGVTYKENVPDTRESPAKEIIKDLKEYGLTVLGYDPLVGNLAEQFDVEAVSDLMSLEGIDCIIVTVAHRFFRALGLEQLRQISNHRPVLLDVRGIFDPSEAVRRGFDYHTL